MTIYMAAIYENEKELWMRGVTVEMQILSTFYGINDRFDFN